MKKLNNNGFMLAEIIIVSVFAIIILVELVTSVSRLFIKYEEKVVYDTVDSVFVARGLLEKYNSDTTADLTDTAYYKNLIGVSSTEKFINNNNVSIAYIVIYKENYVKEFYNQIKNNNSVDERFKDYIINYIRGNDFSDGGDDKYIVFVGTNNDSKIEFGYYKSTQLEEKSAKVESITCDDSSITLDVGGSSDIKCSVSPIGVDNSLSYSSKNTSIATVNSDGKVTGLLAGETEIIVTANGGVTYTISVKINNSLPKPNIPDLSSGLIPVVWDGSQWETVNPYEIDESGNYKWYNYEKQKWANAVAVKSSVRSNYITSNGDGTYSYKPEVDIDINNMLAMFVWIPRFSYTIGCTGTYSCYGYREKDIGLLKPTDVNPGAIDIKFVSADAPKDELKYGADGSIVIPRYTYEVNTSGMPKDGRTPINWYTHPAFTFGGKELSGIWVGKFETSSDSNSTCYIDPSTSNCDNDSQSPRILPNVKSLRYQYISNQFKTAKKMSENANIYGIDKEKADAHMMKNSEWAAVAYLSQSIYGKYGNNDYNGSEKEIYRNDSKSFITGKSAGKTPNNSAPTPNGTYEYSVEKSGTGASTTGNIYGVYDMSGGTFEFVMGNYDQNDIFGDFDFTTVDSKYIDILTTNPLNINKETLGQAYKETAGWFVDAGNQSPPTLNEDGSFAVRGGSAEEVKETVGIFYFSGMWNYPDLGIDISFRISLVNDE